MSKPFRDRFRQFEQFGGLLLSGLSAVDDRTWQGKSRIENPDVTALLIATHSAANGLPDQHKHPLHTSRDIRPTINKGLQVRSLFVFQQDIVCYEVIRGKYPLVSMVALHESDGVLAHSGRNQLSYLPSQNVQFRYNG